VFLPSREPRWFSVDPRPLVFFFFSPSLSGSFWLFFAGWLLAGRVFSPWMSPASFVANRALLRRGIPLFSPTNTRDLFSWRRSTTSSVTFFPVPSRLSLAPPLCHTMVFSRCGRLFFLLYAFLGGGGRSLLRVLSY